MRFLTAGESHGKEMIVIIEGFPANVPVDREKLSAVLSRRRQAPGRSPRMQVETDMFQVVAGMRHGKTLGTPLSLSVPNAEWQKWSGDMNPWSSGQLPAVSIPRPGHADLAGAFKYRQQDIRNISERASARETVVRTLAGSFALQLLNLLGICITGRGLKIGGAADYADAINRAAGMGDTVGGIIEVIITGLPGGIGSHVHWDRRLDARLAGAIMSVQGVKGVEFGQAFESAHLLGSQYHDQFACLSGRIVRETNNAGGIEGGMSNGEPIHVRAMIKPIPTLDKPLKSFDRISKAVSKAPVTRHDVSAVGAAAVVAEAICAWEIAVCIVEQFGGDTLEDLQARYEHFRRRWEEEMSCPGE